METYVQVLFHFHFFQRSVKLVLTLSDALLMSVMFATRKCLIFYLTSAFEDFFFYRALLNFALDVTFLDPAHLVNTLLGRNQFSTDGQKWKVAVNFFAEIPPERLSCQVTGRP